MTSERPPIIQYLPGPDDLGWSRNNTVDLDMKDTRQMIDDVVAALLDPHRQDRDLCAGPIVCNESANYFLAMNTSGEDLPEQPTDFVALQRLRKNQESIMLPYVGPDKATVVIDGQVVTVRRVIKEIEDAYPDGDEDEMKAPNPGPIICGSVILLLIGGMIRIFGDEWVPSRDRNPEGGKTKKPTSTKKPDVPETKDGLEIAMYGDVYPCIDWSPSDDPGKKQADIDAANQEYVRRTWGQGRDPEGLDVFEKFIKNSPAYKDGWSDDEQE